MIRKHASVARRCVKRASTHSEQLHFKLAGIGFFRVQSGDVRRAEAAVAAGAHKITIPLSASETHSLKNVLRTHAEMLDEVRGIVALLRGVPEGWIGANEGGDTWSLYDVVGHLIHGEQTDWLARARIILEQEVLNIDLVISDIYMPKMDGMSLAAEALLLRPDLPVLLVTGYSAGWTRETVRAAGLRDIAYKPLSFAVLGETLHDALHTDPGLA